MFLFKIFYLYKIKNWVCSLGDKKIKTMAAVKYDGLN